ncbi:uncharacterized protein VTP21DRAFT_1015 [Calcarisporiella thermophila]|uniref:uncharacterized protein n=1 Tax=Calcarisporiella thermophila TaxID=911321 RepID=UPI0037441C84
MDIAEIYRSSDSLESKQELAFVAAKKAMRAYYSANAYQFNSKQAEILLNVIRSIEGKLLTKKQIEGISHRLMSDWEPEVNLTAEKNLVRFIQKVLQLTIMRRVTSVEDAIAMSTERDSAFPVLCPSTTLALAIIYLNSLKKRYPKAHGAKGCSCNLFLIAYLMAAKYLQSCIRGSLAQPQLRKSRTISSKNLTENSQRVRQHPYLHALIQAKSQAQSQQQYLMAFGRKSTACLAALLPGITTISRLERMETEFLGFLKNNLTIPKTDVIVETLEQFVGLVQVVPDTQNRLQAILNLMVPRTHNLSPVVPVDATSLGMFCEIESRVPEL